MRAEAKQVGLRAIRRAAIDRQLDDDLSRERRALLAKLGPGCDLRQLATELVAAPFRQELAREAAGEGGDTSAAKCVQGSATCAHVHVCLEAAC